MKFTDNMSVPLWKIKLLQNKQRKKEEEKRKEREAEEERLRKLPPWKRQAEQQPKTVIIIDKNKTPNPVDLAELSKQQSSSSKSKSSSANATAQPLVNGTAQKGEIGGDETDSGAGVSEEHCTPVQNNVFLTLERKKRKAPPPPKGGNQISVISSNVSVTHDPVTSANSSKKTSPNATELVNSSKKPSTQSEPAKGNHIPQSKTLNGPSVVGNQTIISTKPNDDKKRSSKEDVPKPKTGSASPAIKVSNIKVVSSSSISSPVKSDNSATNSRTASSVSVSSSTPSSSKETPQQSQKDEKSKSLGTVIQLGSSAGDTPTKTRKKSISELTSLFGGKIISSPSKTQPPSQINASVKTPQKSSSDLKPQKTTNDVQPASTVGSAKTKQRNSTSSNQKVVSTNEQSVKKEDRKKPEESKKVTEGSVSKSDSKSLPAASVNSPSSPGRQKPSSDLPASAIISLTNEGPLKSREGQLVRSPSVIDDDEEFTISLESHRSPENKRLSKLLGSPEKSSSSAGTVNVSNGSPEKRKASGASQPAQLNGPSKTETKGANSSSKESSDSSILLSNTATKKVEDKEIEYPKNFRDPNYVPKKEESSKKEEIPYPTDFRKPTVSTSTSLKKQDPLKPTVTKASTDKNMDKSPAQSTTEKKNVDKPKESSLTKSDGHIPYPDDFRRPKTQQAAVNKSKDVKDIVKPSDLIKVSSSSSSDKKDDNDNVTSGGLFGLQLRRTKKPETSGISVISQSNDGSKPKVDNSQKAPTSGLVAVGGGGSTTAGKKKTVVKKFEKVEMIGYNSPTGKPSALRKEDAKSAKKGLNVSFSSKEEETYEYMSEEAGIIYYDETHPDGEEEADGGKKSSSVTKAEENGLKNGSLDNSFDSEEEAESSLKSNAPIRSSGGFQNLAAANLSAMDMLLGRGPRPAEPSEPPKPTPPPEQEPEPEDMSFRPMDGDLFSSTGHSTAALLF